MVSRSFDAIPDECVVVVKVATVRIMTAIKLSGCNLFEKSAVKVVSTCHPNYTQRTYLHDRLFW